MKLTLPVEIGRSYVRRDGQTIIASAPQSHFSEYICVAAEGENNTAGMVHVNPSHGKVRADLVEHRFDLMSDALRLPLVAGRWYRRRDGQIVQAQKAGNAISDHTVYVSNASDLALSPHRKHAYKNTGLIYSTEPPTPDPLDIVGDYVVDAESRVIVKDEQGFMHAKVLMEYAQDAQTKKEPWALWHSDRIMNIVGDRSKRKL